MRIGFRSRRRGMIDKILTTKRALVGRMRASPVPISIYRPRAGAITRAARADGAPVAWAAEIRSRPLSPPPRFPLQPSELERERARGSSRDPRGAATRALAFAEAGARFVSVCTDADFSDGRLADLEACRRSLEAAMGEERPDLIADDFIIDPIQIEVLAGLGADAVILRPRLVPSERMAELLERAQDLGVGAWIEIETAPQLDEALGAGHRALLVSSVDLDTLRRDDNGAIELCRRAGASGRGAPTLVRPVVGLRLPPDGPAFDPLDPVDVVFGDRRPTPR